MPTAVMKRAPLADAERSAGVFELRAKRPCSGTIAGLRLVFSRLPGAGAFDVLEYCRELRGVALPPADVSHALLREADWLAPDADLRAIDELFASAAARREWLTLLGGEQLASSAEQMLLRYQRYLPRRNAASDSDSFDHILTLHAALHDVRKPLVRADLDHAVDVWQWTLRLVPDASLAVQLAALFHDVERLDSEADRRIEHQAPDYQAFKDAHARGGARRARAVLSSAGAEPRLAQRVAELIELHEQPHAAQREPELSLLADADALSFFALNSPGFIDYYGPAHTLRKIAYSLARMSAGARRLLAGVKLRADVAELFAQCVSSGAARTAAARGS